MSPYKISSMKALSNDAEDLGPYIKSVAKFYILEPIKAHLRKIFKKNEIIKVKISKGIHSSNLVLIACCYNEAFRLKFFFEYYTAMGIEHFIFIDNGSTDESISLAKSFENVSIFSANGFYKKSRYGVDWVNHLLSKYCKDKWVLFVDVDEFIVFAGNAKDIPDVINYLEKNERDSLQSVMLDMYSDAPGGAPSSLKDGQNPIETSPYYDADGYFIGREIASNTTWIKGGVRTRLFFENLGSGPALNKTPLVKWKSHFAFLKSAHQLWPPYLNGFGETPQSALLHFKFVSNSALYEADIASRHTAEYMSYSQIGTVPTFLSSTSKKYNDAGDLLSDGLIAKIY